MINKKIAVISAKGITVIKNAENPYYNSKFADLQTVVKALEPELAVADLAYKFSTHWQEGCGWMVQMEVYDIATGASDDSEMYSFPITATDPQKFGACITYAKRYLLCTAFNVIAEEDDDGNQASGIDSKPKAVLPKKKPQTLEEQVNDSIPNFFN